MKTLKIKNLEIGTGIPKVCIPIVGSSRGAVIEAAGQILKNKADIVEWRADWYEDIFNWEKTKETLRLLRGTLKELPLLFTFRTAQEGGEKSIDPEFYADLNCRIARSGYADLVDAEYFAGEHILRQIIETAHASNVYVIVSNHDFQKTPPREELTTRLYAMRSLGADIPKIAVMPQSAKDVLNLLTATEEFSSCADCPVITMSMAGTGLISRLCGELFGSSVTFATAGKASAPGQIPAAELETVLQLIHRNLYFF